MHVDLITLYFLAIGTLLVSCAMTRFKAINDQYGHQSGDDVLKSFARVARSVLGRDAILARIGGEEFAAVLAGDAGAHARDLGEDIVRRFAETVARAADGAEIRATVSIGLARSGNDALALGELLALADRALYGAKSLGGNRVEVAGSSPRQRVEPQERHSRKQQSRLAGVTSILPIMPASHSVQAGIRWTYCGKACSAVS